MSKSLAPGVQDVARHRSSTYSEYVGETSDRPLILLEIELGVVRTLDSTCTNERSPIPSILSDSKYTLLEEFELIGHQLHESLLPTTVPNDILSSSCACRSEHALKLESISGRGDDKPRLQSSVAASAKLDEKIKRWFAANIDEDLIDDNVASWNLNDELQWDARRPSLDKCTTLQRERPFRSSLDKRIDLQRERPFRPSHATNIDKLLTRMMRSGRVKQPLELADYRRRTAELEILRNYIDWARDSRKGQDIAHNTSVSTSRNHCGSVPSASSAASSSLSNSEYMWVEI